MSIRTIAIMLLALFFLTGCEEEKPPAEEVIRSLKTMVVDSLAQSQVRKIAGLVEAETVTDLSFEISGKVTDIKVDIGDTVNVGEVVAAMDREPYELRVKSATGELDKAKAQFADAEHKYKQQSQLYQEGFATKSNFDKVEADFKAARSSVTVATTQLEISRRDLRNTTLSAPFAGRIAAKHVEAFTEVTAGQKVLQLQNDGALNVRVSLPETLLQRVAINDQVEVAFATMPDTKIKGHIADIGSQAGTANSFPVKIALDASDVRLNAGMTAEVEFSFKTDATGNAFILPHSAILAGPKEGTAYVFLYDAAASVVRRKTVTPVNIKDNNVEVVGELKKGDIIAVAGVSFLVDNMKVRLLENGD